MFTGSGQLLKMFGKGPGKEGGMLAYPLGIDISADGLELYVADRYRPQMRRNFVLYTFLCIDTARTTESSCLMWRRVTSPDCLVTTS